MRTRDHSTTRTQVNRWLGSALVRVLTGFNASGDFNQKGCQARLRRLAAYGARALFSEGGTGQFLSLTGDEHPTIIQSDVEPSLAEVKPLPNAVIKNFSYVRGRTDKSAPQAHYASGSSRVMFFN